MVAINILNTTKEHLSRLYKHLSVQSLLDIKAVNGEVSEEILDNLLSFSAVSKTVMFGGKIAYSVFVIPSKEGQYSIYLIASTNGYSQTKELYDTFASIIKDLPVGKFYSIVYKGNHKYFKLLKDNGFEFKKNIVHGAENRIFLLLGK